MNGTTWLGRHSLEVQFWGYELGNVVAASTGAGGLIVLWQTVMAHFSEPGTTALIGLARFAEIYPEAFATLGVIVLVVVAVPISRALHAMCGAGASAAAQVLTILLATGLIAYALVADAGFFSIAACAFVAASCFLRSAGLYPVLLKIGGLALAIGGLTLSVAGGAALAAHSFGGGAMAMALGGATICTGLAVAGAGLLTYRGGMFVMATADQAGPPRDIFATVLGSHGWLAAQFTRYVDPVVQWLVVRLVLPSLIWIPGQTRESFPFRTSMLVRLPWRALTAALALSTGTPAGITFALANGLWALGDIAIGALDGPLRRPVMLSS